MSIRNVTTGISNGAVFLFSLATTQFSFAVFKAFEKTSFSDAFGTVLLAAVAWACGAIVAYFIPLARRQSPRFGNICVFAVFFGMLAWPWVGTSIFGFALHGAILFLSGIMIPTIITMNTAEEGAMRESYGQSLVGAGIGLAIASALLTWAGIVPAFCGAAAAAGLVPSVSTSTASTRVIRAISIVFALVALGVTAMTPPVYAPTTKPAMSPLIAPDVPYRLQSDKHLDTYIIGADVAGDIESLVSAGITSNVRSLTVVEERDDDSNDELDKRMARFGVPENVQLSLELGNGRRRLEAESRRFDLIQILLPSAAKTEQLSDQAQGTMTTEAFRLYFDRLKNDGILQIVGRGSSSRSQSIMASINEAWKRTARKDVDLHVAAVGADEGRTIEAILVRMKPFQREERDRLGELLGVSDGGRKWILASDVFGSVLSDDRPFLSGASPSGMLNDMLATSAVVLFLGIFAWIGTQERRKGVASRWQALSVAMYFGGLGLSFGFFCVFFMLRATRAWGMPSVAMALTMTSIMVALAVGATRLVGHPKRRYGVRIQPLANFVFAALFSYLAGALMEPFVASGSEWVSVFVGMSMLAPFGLLGGGFLPNALDEAAEKLNPRVLMLLWSLYAIGSCLGIYAATRLGISSGLSVVFLAGLIAFAWVAIVGGLVRPWSVRKTSSGGNETTF